MSAVRVARGYTGRDLILKFVGCYHGHSDGLLVKAGSGLLTNAVPDSAGVPKAFTDCTLLAEYNNVSQVEDLFSEYGDRIACVVVEPVAANMGVVPPQPGFLSVMRRSGILRGEAGHGDLRKDCRRGNATGCLLRAA